MLVTEWSLILTMATDRTFVVLIVLCILQFRCTASSSDSLGCFNERFNFTKISNISINGQSELNHFVNNLADDEDGCIQLFLTGKSYTLDMIEIMRIKLGTSGGLVIIGVTNPRVRIKCIASLPSLEELINSTLVANVSLVVLDGLVFTKCPVPVVLERVATVIVQNCEFM